MIADGSDNPTVLKKFADQLKLKDNLMFERNQKLNELSVHNNLLVGEKKEL